MKATRVMLMASTSIFAARLAKDLTDSEIEIVGSVFSGNDIFTGILAKVPDVLVLDTRNISFDIKTLAQKTSVAPYKVPLLLLCEAGDPKLMQYKAVSAGIARLPMQQTPIAYQTFLKDLRFHIRLAKLAPQKTSMPAANLSGMRWRPGQPFSTRFTGIIAIGASAGGTEATQEVLKDLPPNMPGIVVTQHMPPVFTKVYAQRLNSTCQLIVREAKDYASVEAGVVLVAPGGVQMQVQKLSGQPGPIVRCTGEERVSGHCPSVDVLFDSVAKSMGRNAIGVILTGMGADGSDGLLRMRNIGCHTLGQDEDTSMVYGMPRVAFEKGAVAVQLPLNEIAQALVSHLIAYRP